MENAYNIKGKPGMVRIIGYNERQRQQQKLKEERIKKLAELSRIIEWE
jgi:hypothetical protein